ncbi:MAG: hypothetical protein LBL30_01585 [Holosporales bacterium]|jgi:hypothetical protein|nr:hypothetical protein [Holosporales bacterium]
MKRFIPLILTLVSLTCHAAVPEVPSVPAQEFSSKDNLDAVTHYLHLSPEGRTALERFNHVKISVKDGKVVNIEFDMREQSLVERREEVKQNVVEQVSSFLTEQFPEVDFNMDFGCFKENLERCLVSCTHPHCLDLFTDDFDVTISCFNFNNKTSFSLNESQKKHITDTIFAGIIECRKEAFCFLLDLFLVDNTDEIHRQIQSAKTSESIKGESADFALTIFSKKIGILPQGSEFFGLATDKIRLITSETLVEGLAKFDGAADAVQHYNSLLQTDASQFSQIFKQHINDVQQTVLSSIITSDEPKPLHSCITLAVDESYKEAVLDNFSQIILRTAEQPFCKKNLAVFLVAHDLIQKVTKKERELVLVDSYANFFGMNYPFIIFNLRMPTIEAQVESFLPRENRLAFTESDPLYTTNHEIGHGIHQVLGLFGENTKGLMRGYLDHPFTKVLLFKEADRTLSEISREMSRLLTEIESDQSQISSFIDFSLRFWVINNVFGDRLQKKGGILPSVEVFRTTYPKALLLDIFIDIWHDPREVFNVTGLLVVNGTLILNKTSDLGLSIERGIPYRWNYGFSTKQTRESFCQNQLQNLEHNYNSEQKQGLEFATWVYRELIPSLDLRPDLEAFKMLEALYKQPG